MPPPRPESSRLLEGRTAVVTGGARGIGHAIGLRLAAHGAAVALLDLDQEQVGLAARGVTEAAGVPTLGLAVDVTDATAVGVAADRVQQELGVADIVVPNAGILVIRPALELEPRQFEAVLRVNVLGAFQTAAEFGRRLVTAGRAGSVIFTSSLFGTRGGAGNAAYSASKFAIIGLAQSMAAELAPAGIRVNTVCPGQIDSVMMDHLFEERAAAADTTSEQERARFVSRIPLGRLGDPPDVADTYVYLASSLSAYVTGQHIIVDGGWNVG